MYSFHLKSTRGTKVTRKCVVKAKPPYYRIECKRSVDSTYERFYLVLELLGDSRICFDIACGLAHEMFIKSGRLSKLWINEYCKVHRLKLSYIAE